MWSNYNAEHLPFFYLLHSHFLSPLPYTQGIRKTLPVHMSELPQPQQIMSHAEWQGSFQDCLGIPVLLSQVLHQLV